jgi:uncharacterized protein YkwD
MRIQFGAAFMMGLVLLAGCSGLASSDEEPELTPTPTKTPTEIPTPEDATPEVTPTPQPSSFNASAFRQTFVNEVKEARSEGNISSLEYREDWQSVADATAEDLAEERAFQNNIIDSQEFNATYRLEEEGYSCSIEANERIHSAGSVSAYNWINTRVDTTTDGARYFTSEEELAKFMANRQMLSVQNETEQAETREIVYRDYSKYHTVGVHVDNESRVWLNYIVC